MRTLLLFLGFISGTFAFAQTTVQGKVVDQNGQPVANANIVVIGQSEGAVADFDGNFAFSSAQTPPFSIRVSSLGYTTATISYSGSTATVVLNEASTALDEIVISASRTPERIFESPVSVERFGLAQIQNATSESFYGSLQNLKGVDINTNSLTFQSINTRGFATFANTRFLQLVDGMDNTAPGLNFVLGNLVGMSELDVQSVEILPGASSALYGAGAFNGILFMTSKDPFETEGISVYGKTGYTVQDAAGTNEYSDYGVRLAKRFSDKLAVKANFTFMQGEDWHANDRTDVSASALGYDWASPLNNPAYNGLNVYGDEVSTRLNFDFFAGTPAGTFGSAVVARTGYDEADVADYGAQSVKRDVAVHYRPFGDDLEVVYNYRRGTGTTIYQGANRYAVSGFAMTQQKLEIKNDNFFIRGYITAEDSGDAYDTRFAAININRQWSPDQKWFEDYVRGYLLSRQIGKNDQDAHRTARQVADYPANFAGSLGITSATGFPHINRFQPGSAEFNDAFAKVKQDGNFNTGARFIDNTKFRHINGNYNFAHLINDWADLQVGGSYRQYELNSNGTIFTDIDGPITYSEYGAYTQLQKTFADERAKLTASARYDKNEFLDGFVSPRVSLGYTLGAQRNHNIRVSAQTGFRNPTTQDFFIGLDVGNAILVGGAAANLDRDVRTFPVSAQARALGIPATSTIVGRAAYENSFSLSSVLAGAPVAKATRQVQAEQIDVVEAGYRGKIGRFVVDVSAYYNSYTNFNAAELKVVPLYGTAGDNQLSLLALQNGDFKVYQAYTNTEVPVKSYGFVAGVDTKVAGFDLGVNYTYTALDFNRFNYPDFQVGLNTPQDRFKASLGHSELFKNFGFNLNYRYSGSYLWEASFATGEVPAFDILDAAMTYKLPQYNTVLKLGGSNVAGGDYITAIGTGMIGSIYYAAININF
jgi:outer membrane receptor protein involved in Fe transport